MPLLVAEAAVAIFLIAEVAVAENGWRDEGPGVEGGAEPGGDNFHPHGRRVGGEVRQVALIIGAEGNRKVCVNGVRQRYVVSAPACRKVSKLGLVS